MNIRLLIWNTKFNYKVNESDTACPFFCTEEDTIGHMIVCQEGNNTYDIVNKNEKEWGK